VDDGLLQAFPREEPIEAFTLNIGTILESGAPPIQPMLRRPTLLAIAFIGASCALAQNEVSISGETTEGSTVELPGASRGKYCILALAASKKAEPMLQEWYEPAYLRFVAKQGLFASEHEVDLWLVPIFTGLNKTAFGPAMKRLREEADPEIARHVVFVKDDAAMLLAALGLKEKDVPYFFLFDHNGKMVHQEHGSFTVEKLDSLEEAMNE
jgi:hypothetical protein